MYLEFGLTSSNLHKRKEMLNLFSIHKIAMQCRVRFEVLTGAVMTSTLFAAFLLGVLLYPEPVVRNFGEPLPDGMESRPR
jgi:hypothetical protein